MINIILSCSQQSWNKCVMGDSEEDHTYAIAEKAGLLLQDYDCNLLVISKDIIGSEAETLTQVVNLSNDFAYAHGGQSFHLDIHTDGGYQGKGSSGFYISENGRQFITLIQKEVASITPWLDTGVSQRNDLYVLKKTQAVAGLIELSFHDNYEEAKHIHENMDLYAMAIVRGLVKACSLQLKKKEHWASKHYISLKAKGWNIQKGEFDRPPTRGELFALLDQIPTK